MSQQPDANFVALTSQVKNRKSKPDAILQRFDAATSQGFRTCSKLSAILLRFFNDESRGTPRDVLSRSLMEEKKRTKNRSWSYNEEVAVIELWQNFPRLFNTSCVDYKRHNKRAAALQVLQAKLEEQFNDSFTGKFLIYL